MSPEGGLNLIDYRHGRYDAGKRMRICIGFIVEHGLQTVFVQPMTGDKLFRDRLNDRLLQAAIEATVREFEYEGGVPG